FAATAVRLAPFRTAEAEAPAPATNWKLPSGRPLLFSVLVSAVIVAFLVDQVSTRSYHGFYPWLALLAVLLPVPALVWRDLCSGRAFHLGLVPGEGTLLIAVVVACGLVLSHHLTAVPQNMWGDEGAFWERAIAISNAKSAEDFFAPGVYGF